MKQRNLIDGYGRRITDLRISITEACNFRCSYCIPHAVSGARVSSRGGLGNDSITRIVRVFADLGIRRLRLTGGEPLLRPDLIPLVSALAATEGIQKISLTTNGSLLTGRARRLHEAGLNVVTISLDSLRPERFRAICGRDRLQDVLDGIREARGSGLTVKVNAVLLKGRTEAEIDAFVDLANAMALRLRFIEWMPFAGNDWNREGVLTAGDVRRHILRRHRLVALPREFPSQTSTDYRIPGRRGSIGFIASVTEPFCERCSRMRLTAEGVLRSCLHADDEVDLRPSLREAGDGGLRERILEAVRGKPAGHADWTRKGAIPVVRREMVRLGG